MRTAFGRPAVPGITRDCVLVTRVLTARPQPGVFDDLVHNTKPAPAAGAWAQRHSADAAWRADAEAARGADEPTR
jgi:hypothetical protein